MAAVIEKVRDAMRKATVQAQDAYRRLLAGHDGGNPETVLRTVRQAGKTEADFERDARIVERHRQLKRQAEGLAEAQAKRNEASRAYSAYVDDTRRIVAERERAATELWVRSEALQAECKLVQDAAKELQLLELAHAELLGFEVECPQTETGRRGAHSRSVGTLDLAEPAKPFRPTAERKLR